MTEQEERAAVVAEAMTWLRTPYHHQGRIKGVGVDCATILLETFHAALKAENAFPEYSPEWHLHRSEEVYLSWMKKYTREVEAPDVGDIVVWRWGRCFSHGSIYLGDGQLIHSEISTGCVLASMSDGMFENRPHKFFSYWAK